MKDLLEGQGAEEPEGNQHGDNEAKIADAVDTICPALELVDDRNADYGDISSLVLTLIADNAWNAGIVLGSAVSDWHALDLESIHGMHRVVVRAEAAAYHADRFRERPEAFGPDIRNSIVSGLMVPAAHYLKALRLRARFVRRMDRLCAPYDLVVAPAALETAPLAEVSTGSPLFNEPCSISGHPAITLPIGRGDNNLPAGIQLFGSRVADADLLAAARWCEAELGWRAEIAELAETPERKRGSA